LRRAACLLTRCKAGAGPHCSLRWGNTGRGRGFIGKLSASSLQPEPQILGPTEIAETILSLPIGNPPTVDGSSRDYQTGTTAEENASLTSCMILLKARHQMKRRSTLGSNPGCTPSRREMTGCQLRAFVCCKSARSSPGLLK